MLFTLLATLAIVSVQAQTPPAREFEPLDANAAVFWSRQTTESAELLRGLAEKFNAQSDGLDIKVVHAGSYADIYQKTSASIQAGVLPALSVAYENMTIEYVASGAVQSLEAFVTHPEYGLSETELADFFPVILKTNRYPQFGNELYSFPFAKSVLVMYFNREVMTKAGLETPPGTWDAFLQQCRQIKAKTGGYAYAMDVDASTFNAMIFSMGGEVYRDGKMLYDSPATVKALELLGTLTRERLAYQIPKGTFDDEAALAAGRVAFTLRTSAGKASVAQLFGGENARWGLARLPQADPEKPATVLFGSNVVVFNTTPAHEEVAWRFLTYFTSTEVCVEWALATGYLPMRKSAVQAPEMQAYFDRWAYNRVPYDSLGFAQSEPAIEGWQSVRSLAENAVTSVITGMQSPEAAAAELNAKANALLDAR
jgi:multiple sugar transport system substrate-binding protein